MIDVDKEKCKFVAEVAADSQCDTRVLAAVTLGVTHLIQGDNAERELPIVVCSHDSFRLNKALELLQSFYRRIHPETPKDAPYISPDALNLVTMGSAGGSTEQSLIDYCNKLRDHGPSLLYWADSASWFQYMPSGMFYVIDLNGQDVVGCINGGVYVRPQPVRNAAPVEDVHMQYYHEVESGILRVITAPEGEFFDPVITIESPAWQKEACVALRRYLGRECDCGMQWDSSDVAWKDATVHPLTVPGIQIHNSCKTSQGLIGMVVFDKDSAGNHFLTAAWIHPFYRRKGRLRHIWSSLVHHYGQFAVEDPSSNMQKFLKSVDHKGKFLGCF